MWPSGRRSSRSNVYIPPSDSRDESAEREIVAEDGYKPAIHGQRSIADTSVSIVLEPPRAGSIAGVASRQTGTKALTNDELSFNGIVLMLQTVLTLERQLVTLYKSVLDL
jgi:hypothetical protein